MAYREITRIEIKEVLRRWVRATPKKRLAAQLGLDPKTVRRYVQVAAQCGVESSMAQHLRGRGLMPTRAAAAAGHAAST